MEYLCERGCHDVPPELQRALDANPLQRRTGRPTPRARNDHFFHMVNGAKRPETREKYVKRVMNSWPARCR
jgi:uncharacterized protein YdeI (YjbR/CyaY-like superfamily)